MSALRAVPGGVGREAATRPAPQCEADRLLDRVRLGWIRLTARQAADCQAEGALLIDVRTETQRAETGEIPGAIVIDLTVLEWRLDPTSPDRIPEATQHRPIVLICRQGFCSSLAVGRLRCIGVRWVTDVIDGVEGWLAAGLPLDSGPADVRR